MKVYVSSTSLSVFSMIGACMSSVHYVLLCVTGLSQRKILNEREGVVFEFFSVLVSKTGLNLCIILSSL